MIAASILLASVGAAGQAPTGVTTIADTKSSIVADASKAPQVAPDLPLTKDAASAERTVSAKDDLAALGDGEAPKAIQNGPWKTIGREQRRMLIMGSSDGFAAAGQEAPCFPGRDADKLDRELTAAGFGESSAERLPEALAKIAGRSGCGSASPRTYGSGYLMKIPSQDLAVYLTGAIRAYARVKPCQPEFQSYAATLAMTAIGLADDDENPIVPLGVALAQGCAKPSR